MKSRNSRFAKFSRYWIMKHFRSRGLICRCPLDDLNSGIPDVIERENCKIGRSRIEHS